MAKCIMELERIYGVRQGSANKKGDNRIGDRDNLYDKKTQQDLANEIGINEKQLQEYKKLTTLIPELQQMVENGSMKATVGYKNKLNKQKKKRKINNGLFTWGRACWEIYTVWNYKFKIKKRFNMLRFMLVIIIFKPIKPRI